MANFTQPGTPFSMLCSECEDSIMDFLDGTLSPAQQAAFDLHIAICPACSQALADAQRGAAWLEMLRTPRPEPSAALLERILMQTSGAYLAENHSPAILPANLDLGRTIPFVPAKMTPVSTQPRGVILPFRSRVAAPLRTLGQTFLQPRLAMTAAMAFFSIALTLNLTGIRLSELHASDWTPSGISRGISNVRGHAVRYYDNLPVVYELESRVNTLKRANDDDDRHDPYRPGQDVFNGSQSDPEPAKNTDKPQQDNKPAEPQKNSGTTPYLAPDRRSTPVTTTVSLNSSRKIIKEGGLV